MMVFFHHQVERVEAELKLLRQELTEEAHRRAHSEALVASQRHTINFLEEALAHQRDAVDRLFPKDLREIAGLAPVDPDMEDTPKQVKGMKQSSAALDKDKKAAQKALHVAPKQEIADAPKASHRLSQAPKERRKSEKAEGVTAPQPAPGGGVQLQQPAPGGGVQLQARKSLQDSNSAPPVGGGLAPAPGGGVPVGPKRSIAPQIGGGPPVGNADNAGYAVPAQPSAVPAQPAPKKYGGSPF
eukprot:gnl/MRDRNA2_/MRDRNA2_32787_c0_seq2.p1 gnl/MRDRNA2_/MRDRNA2_32787_c0~~gnl/MRDRNA2_/MRDRNA2_32787_c0_seq2.p1  ORF type:complete len:242 (-),score=56.58 gnl/MRDRNA2_/MRDRNA2_32787_c0_seq2:148-873(-)